MSDSSQYVLSLHPNSVLIPVSASSYLTWTTFLLSSTPSIKSRLHLSVVRHSGGILGPNWDKILKSFPPCDSQSSSLTDLTPPPTPPTQQKWREIGLYGKHCIFNSQFWELSRLCPETSTKLYVHEFGLQSHFLLLPGGRKFDRKSLKRVIKNISRRTKEAQNLGEFVPKKGLKKGREIEFPLPNYERLSFSNYYILATDINSNRRERLWENSSWTFAIQPNISAETAGKPWKDLSTLVRQFVNTLFILWWPCPRLSSPVLACPRLSSPVL